MHGDMNSRIDSYLNEMQEMRDIINGQNDVIKKVMDKVDELEKTLQSRGSKGSGSGSGSGSRRTTALYKRIEKDESAVTARKENIKEGRRGSIRVGRIAQRSAKGEKYPKTEGYVNIAVTSHNASGVGSELSPFKLKDEQGHLMENIWQFSKVYSFVPDHIDKKTGWSHDREIHINKKTQTINSEYWDWRKKGMTFEEPMRYPVGISHRQYCKYSLWPESGDLADAVDMNENAPAVKYKYVPARVKIYCPVYMEMAKKNEDFDIISQLLNEGYNVQILDVDGPDRPKVKEGQKVPAPYDQMPDGTYGENGVGSIEINENNIKTMLTDVTQPFGHGYALACLLLGHPEWIADFDVSEMNNDSPDVQTDDEMSGETTENL